MIRLKPAPSCLRERKRAKIHRASGTLLYEHVSRRDRRRRAPCQTAEARNEGGRRFDCDLLWRGFARLRCEYCKESRLVAFACKGGVLPLLRRPARGSALPRTRVWSGATSLTSHPYPSTTPLRRAHYKPRPSASTRAGRCTGSSTRGRADAESTRPDRCCPR